MRAIATTIYPYKYDIVCFSFLATSIAMSIKEALDDEALPCADFNPNGKDTPTWRRMMWYFSQLTYVSQITLCMYHGLKLIGIQSDDLFAGVAPICLTVNILYFKVLFPKKASHSDELHELRMSSIIPHLLDTVMIITEAMTISKFPISSVKYSSMFAGVYLLNILVNYGFRQVWPYGLLDLTKPSGFKWLCIAYCGNVGMFGLLLIINRLSGN